MWNEDDLVRRATAAYFRKPILGDYVGLVIPQQPNAGLSGVEEHNMLQYVVLRNVKGILAVYRIGTNGILRRLRRWPKEID